MVAEIFAKLEATPKRNEKIAILAANKDNETLKAVLRASLDPYVTYNVKKIPKFTTMPTGNTLDDYIDQIQQLAERAVTGYAGIDFLAECLGNLPHEDAIIAQRIIKKDLRCGVQASTVNKVWKDLIPTYPCLLGNAYTEKSIQSIEYPAYSQTKADGMRCNAFIYKRGTGEITLRGRSGKFIHLLGSLDEALLPFACYQTEYVMDGELIVVDDNGKVLPRKIGNGILNKAIKGTITKEEADRVRFRAWDLIPLEAFKEKIYTVPYMARFRHLEHDMHVNGTDRVQLIDYQIVNNMDEAWAHYEEMIAAGEEGTMLKNTKHIWEDKRSKGLVKLKAEEECELEVIGYNPGTTGTKNDGKVGSLVCASLDRKVEVSISGFSDELRDEITRDIAKWIGRIVTVKYNERIADRSRKDIDSLFLPRFQELREDKVTADHSSVIL